MKTTILLAIIATACAAVAFGRLGESSYALTERYGESQFTRKDPFTDYECRSYRHRDSEVIITAYLSPSYDCDAIELSIYRHEQSKRERAVSAWAPIPDADMKAFLSANSDGKPWDPLPPQMRPFTHRRKDGSALVRIEQQSDHNRDVEHVSVMILNRKYAQARGWTSKEAEERY